MVRENVFTIIILVVIVAAVLGLPLTFIIYSLFIVEDPDFTYGEFPVELTYEINGEEVTVNEIYVVEYSAFNPMRGYIWTGYIQSTKEKGIILYEDDDLKVICELGYPGYYISEFDSDKAYIVTPNVYELTEKRTFLFSKETEKDYLTETELYEKYGIKIISWTTADPIDMENLEE